MRESELKINGRTYKILDFLARENMSFLMENITKKTAETIFKDVTEVLVDNIPFKDLVFSGVYETQTCVQVMIHIKSTLEIASEKANFADETVREVEDALLSSVETQGITNAEVEDALCEIYEMLGDK